MSYFFDDYSQIIRVLVVALVPYCLLGTNVLVGQDNCAQDLEQIYSTPADELLSIDYKYLEQLDSTCVVGFLDELLKYSKSINHRDLKIKSFRYLAAFTSYPQNLAYADSMIKYTSKYLEHPDYDLPHYLKGIILYDHNKAVNSMKSFIDGYKRAKEQQDVVMIIDYLCAMGSVKGTYSKDKDAILLIHKAYGLQIRHKELFGDEYIDQLLYSIDNITIHHMEYKNLDSAMFYIKKAEDLFEDSMNKDYWKTSFDALKGETNYYLGNYFNTIKTLYPILNNSPDENNNNIEKLYYVGMSEGFLGRKNLKDSIFNEIEKTFKREFGYTPNMGNVYQYLLENAILDGDKENQIKFLANKAEFDSIMEYNAYNLMYLDSEEFSVPKLLDSRKELQQVVETKDNVILVWIVITICILLIGVYFGVRYIKTRNRLKQVIKSGIKTKTKKHSSTDKPNKSLLVVLDNLNEWEKKTGFLNQSITQQSLAKELNTNDTYLSQVVNNFKNQKFSDYLKDLRITYLINDIRLNPEKVINKSQIQIAELYGFNSVDVFRRALLEKINVTPAKFIKEIKNSNL